ncbi:MAG: ABC transporter permease [Nevskiales bacterium]
MMALFGIPAPLLFGQLLLGLINGAFYALLSLGLAVIFGMLNIINFAHGALFMMGAFVAWGLLQYLGLNYWWALLITPVLIGALGLVLERLFIQRLRGLDHLYGLLLTLGMALIIEGLFRNTMGSAALSYEIPAVLQGSRNLGFMFMPNYRGWVVLVALATCLGTWVAIEKTSLGATLRAATENAPLVQAFGVNVPRLITLTYGAGVALAAFAGVLAAPIYSVSPNMGSNFIITVFAVVIIGGMGSILGSIVTGFGLGLVEGLTKVFYPAASATVVFLVMVVVLLARPAGLFGREMQTRHGAGTLTETMLATTRTRQAEIFGFSRAQAIGLAAMIAAVVAGPFLIYPIFLMKVLCFALFTCAFNLLIGYVGLLSFGHAAYYGMGSYVAAWTARAWGLPPELALLAGGGAGLALGALFGWLAIRRQGQGLYFATITLALSQMVYFYCVQATGFTGGEDGIQGVPRGRLFGFIPLASDMSMYWFVAGVFIALFLLIHRIVNSPFGQVLKGIRENEQRAVSLGYRTNDFKLIAYILSCTISGLAGGLQALVFGIATLEDVHYSASGEVVLMTLLGGVGTIFGPVAGALLMTTIENYLANLGAWVTVIQGTIFVACVLAFRKGIIGTLGARLRVDL